MKWKVDCAEAPCGAEIYDADSKEQALRIAEKKVRELREARLRVWWECIGLHEAFGFADEIINDLRAQLDEAVKVLQVTNGDASWCRCIVCCEARDLLARLLPTGEAK